MLGGTWRVAEAFAGGDRLRSRAPGAAAGRPGAGAAVARAGKPKSKGGHYKMKTRKAALKRYKVTAGGKVLRRKPGKQHINKRKSRKRLRRLGQENPVHFGEVATVAECLPYAKVDVAKAKLQTKSDRAPRPRK